MRARSLQNSLRAREATIHQYVCDYLKLQYKDVIYRTDFAAGIKMTMGQAIAHKRLQSGRAYPDLFIAEPRAHYHGMYLELKRDGTRVYLKNGELSTDPHIQEQAAVLADLRSRGYYAEFAVGFDDAKAQVDTYLKNSQLKPD